jgi:hypothetical protein
LHRIYFIAFKIAKMLKTTLLTLGVSLVILLIAVMAMAFRPLFLKKRFPNIHIGGNKALKERGISCATSQDREAQNQAKKHNYKYKIDNK